MMNRTFWKFGAALGVAAGALLAAPATSGAAPINLMSVLANPSFEDGGLANVGSCPVGWTCSNSSQPIATEWKVTEPTSLQYPTPNGLPTGQFVPNGSFVSFTPASNESNTELKQSVATQWIKGGEYVLEFWLGDPIGGVFPTSFIITLLNGPKAARCDNGVVAELTGDATLGGKSPFISKMSSDVDCKFTLPSSTSPGSPNVYTPDEGGWRHYTLTLVNNGDNAQVGNIGISFSMNGGSAQGNGGLMHLDLGPLADPRDNPNQLSAVPEPATLMLLGMGLAGVAATVRRRRQLGN